MLSQIRHSQHARVACYGALALVALGRFQAPLCAQQREPAIEVYGLAGTYFFGNSSNLLKNGEWRPQIALGALFPMGPKWAVLVDGSRSRLQVQEGLHSPSSYTGTAAFYQPNPGIPDEDHTTQRLIAILPSVVRLWRRERFSLYLGGGLGFESQSQLIRHRLVTELPGPEGERPVDDMGNFTYGTLVRAGEFTETADVVTNGTLILRGGVLVNLAPRIVFRAGYSLLPAYVDTPASQSLEVGIGYRF